MTLQQAVILTLQISILLTVFGYGLKTTVGDMLYVLRQPWLLVRSLLAMFVIMPVVAVALAKVFSFLLPVEIALVALSISPIPPLLPGKEERTGGHVPFGLGLMAVIGLLSIVVVPFGLQLVSLFFTRSLTMSSAAIAAIIFKAIMAPLVAGLALRALLPAVADRIASPASLVAKVLLAVGIIALLIGTVPAAVALIGNGTLIAMIAFIVVGLAVGHWLGGPNPGHRLVLALSNVSRHPAIALAIGRVNFPDEPNLTAALVLYLILNLVVGIPYNNWQQRNIAAAATQ